MLEPKKAMDPRDRRGKGVERRKEGMEVLGEPVELLLIQLLKKERCDSELWFRQCLLIEG